ncbi:putative ribonuclease H-like domain-containing protein [Tanacetum coccineum]
MSMFVNTTRNLKSNFMDRVYQSRMSLYGLHQAPRAWYETLSTLLENRFQRGHIDKTLFIKRDQGDILIVQVYVDDIIFGSTKKKLCTEFEKMIHQKFQMSSMGELTFFLGLQVKHKEDEIFISQYKYVTEILKKFGFSDVKIVNTPLETHKPLLKDADGEDVDEHVYRSMIGSLMYLTSSRPDIMFVVCVCARFQVNPKVSHLHAVKIIFSDYAGASLDRKSTTGGCQFLGCRLISWQCKKQTVVANSTTEAEYVAASSCCSQLRTLFLHLINNAPLSLDINSSRESNEKEAKFQMIKIHTDKNVVDLLTKAFDIWAATKVETVNGEVQLHALVDRKKVIITESTIRRDLQLEDAEGTDCLPNATIFEQLTHMGYEKLSQKLTFYKAFFSPQWKFLIHTILQCLSAKSTAWNEFSSTMASAIICLATNQKFNFSKYIFEIGDLSTHAGNFCYTLSPKKVVGNLNMGLGQKAFSGAVTPLFPTMMVQAQEEMGEGSANPIDPHHTPIWRKITDIDQDVEVTLVDETQGSEKVVEEVVSTVKVNTAATITTEEITLAQALAELRSAKPKVVVQEPVQSTTTTTPSTIPKAKSITFRDLGESTTRTTLTTISTKHQALRAQEKRNKPPTKAQKKSTMSTYLKHMAGYKQSQLKNKSFAEIQKLFDKAMTRVNMFVDMDTKLVKESSKKTKAEMAQESSSKRAGDELEQEPLKKQKMKDDKEKTVLSKPTLPTYYDGSHS